MNSNHPMIASKYNNRYKKQLLERINKLTCTEHDEIFKIMKSCDIPFTENKNGTFFNLTIVSDNVVEQVEKFVEFCHINQKELDEYDKKINECKLSNNFNSISSSSHHKYEGSSFHLANALKNTHGSQSLGAVIALATERNEQEITIAAVLQEMKKREKVNNFITMLEDNIDKIHRKKTNVKFLNAKKRYSKKFVSDKKVENDLLGNLDKETYFSKT